MMKSNYRNIFWFLIDGLSPLYLRACGNKAIGSTFFDELLEKGTVLSSVYAPGGGTFLSMYSYFSGLYPSINGMEGFSPEAVRNFRPEIWTITDVLRERGFRTYYYTDADELDEGKENIPTSGFEVRNSSGYVLPELLYKTKMGECEKQIAFVERINQTSEQKFIYCHYSILHELNASLGCSLDSVWKSDDYIANIRKVSAAFERFYKRFNITDQDLVILSNDHGVHLDCQWAMIDHDYPKHYEIASLCFMGLIGGGLRRQLLPELVSVVDVAPTLMEMICNIPYPCNGHSQVPYIIKGKYTPRPCLGEKGALGETSFYSPDKCNLYIVREGQYKYTYSPESVDSEWLMFLPDGEYKINRKTQHPELCIRYRNLLNQELIHKKFDISSFYKEHHFMYDKRTIKPVISIMICGNWIPESCIESTVDFVGPPYEVLLTSKQAKMASGRVLRHVRTKVVNSPLKQAHGKYILCLSCRGLYYGPNLLDEFIQKMGNTDKLVVMKDHPQICMYPLAMSAERKKLPIAWVCSNEANRFFLFFWKKKEDKRTHIFFFSKRLVSYRRGITRDILRFLRGKRNRIL